MSFLSCGRCGGQLFVEDGDYACLACGDLVFTSIEAARLKAIARMNDQRTRLSHPEAVRAAHLERARVWKACVGCGITFRAVSNQKWCSDDCGTRLRVRALRARQAAPGREYQPEGGQHVSRGA